MSVQPSVLLQIIRPSQHPYPMLGSILRIFFLFYKISGFSARSSWKSPHYNINKRKFKCLDLHKLLTFVSSFKVPFIPFSSPAIHSLNSLGVFSMEPHYLSRNSPANSCGRKSGTEAQGQTRTEILGYDMKSIGMRKTEQLWALYYVIVKLWWLMVCLISFIMEIEGRFYNGRIWVFPRDFIIKNLIYSVISYESSVLFIYFKSPWLNLYWAVIFFFNTPINPKKQKLLFFRMPAWTEMQL